MQSDIIRCDKNKEGSKILVSDKEGTVTLFNFLKHLEAQPKQTQVPTHKRNDPVVCIDVTGGSGVINPPASLQATFNLATKAEVFSETSSQADPHPKQ